MNISPFRERFDMKRLTTLAIVLLAFSAALFFTIGCDNIKEAISESKKWRTELSETREQLQKQINETREVAKTVAEAAIKSVPGERYLQIIDALHGQDENKKREAQRFLKSIANIDVESPLEVSVWFTFPDGEQLKADIFRAPSPHRIHVKEHIDNQRLNLTQVSSIRQSTLTEDELRVRMQVQVFEAINTLCGSANHTVSTDTIPSFSGTSFHGVPSVTLITRIKGTLSWISPYFQPMLEPVNKQIPNGHEQVEISIYNETVSRLKAQVSAGRNQVASQLVDAMMMAFKPLELPLGNRRLSKPWLAMDGNQFLFVLLPLKQWEKLKNSGLEIRTLVHVKGNGTSAYQDARQYQFIIDEFSPTRHEPIQNPDYGQIVWAVHNMTDNDGISLETLNKINKIREILKNWESEKQNS